jgi:hypothetical protein
MFCVPLHPFTTALFLLITVGVVLTTYASSPKNALVTLGLFAIAVPVYYAFLTRPAFVKESPGEP